MEQERDAISLLNERLFPHPSIMAAEVQLIGIARPWAFLHRCVPVSKQASNDK